MSAQDQGKFAKLKDKIQEKLDEALGIKEFDITLASKGREKSNGAEVWRVNIEFSTKDDRDQGYMRYASCMLDVKDLEVLRFERDRCWDPQSTTLLSM